MAHSNFNYVPGYIRFGRTISYLKECASSVENITQGASPIFPDEKQMHSLRIEHLLHLKEELPYQFLSLIGADREKIEMLAKRDEVDFNRVVKRDDFIVNTVTVRLMSAVYQTRALPYAMAEKEAITYTLENFSKNRFRCAINFPDIKTIFIEIDGEVDVIYYPPTIDFGETSIIPSLDGSREGIAYTVQ